MKTICTRVSRTMILGFLFAFLAAVSATGQVAARYSDYVKTNDDSRLISLTTELQSSLYLTGNSLKKLYGSQPALVLISDAGSVAMMYEENTDFETVELITIRIKNPEDETARLDVGKLTSFKNLKYLIFVYQYDACGQEGKTCLQAKTEEKAAIPAESGIQVLFLLSIPQ